MQRVWVVDDAIPVHLLYKEREALRHDRDLVNTLLDERHASQWPDGADDPVRLLCREVCEGYEQCIFFTSPDHAVRALEDGAAPPHVIVYDWEYQSPVDNNKTIGKLLSDTFSYLQVYTHLSAKVVDAELEPLRVLHGKRLLPALTKSAVNPESLKQIVTKAWKGTIAGDLADSVRATTISAIEHALIDMGSVPKAALGAIAEGKSDNLIQMIVSRIREELGVAEVDALAEMVKSSDLPQSSDGVRRLMSLWYYWFPTDDRVRRGDIISVGGKFGLVVTPACDLAKFKKKTGRRLTWIELEPLESPSAALHDLDLDTCAPSLTGKYGNAGENVVILPNAPASFGSRAVLADFVLMCHAWHNAVFTSDIVGPLRYGQVELTRLCTVAEPFATAVISRAQSVISSPAPPNFPVAEVTRIASAIKATRTPAKAAPKVGEEAKQAPRAEEGGGGTPSA